MADAQWVLITGAARPTGLGYWTAKRLIADGSASVILSAKTQAIGAPDRHRNCTRGRLEGARLPCRKHLWWVASHSYHGHPAASAQTYDHTHIQVTSFHAKLCLGWLGHSQ